MIIRVGVGRIRKVLVMEIPMIMEAIVEEMVLIYVITALSQIILNVILLVPIVAVVRTMPHQAVWGIIAPLIVRTMETEPVRAIKLTTSV